MCCRAAFLTAFGVWGGLCVGRQGSAGALGRPSFNPRRLGHALWAGVAAIAAVVSLAEVCSRVSALDLRP